MNCMRIPRFLVTLGFARVVRLPGCHSKNARRCSDAAFFDAMGSCRINFVKADNFLQNRSLKTSAPGPVGHNELLTKCFLGWVEGCMGVATIWVALLVTSIDLTQLTFQHGPEMA